MTPTNEQIFAEAIRRQKERGGGAVTDLIIEVVRENWTPPEPVVDPDLLAFTEWWASGYSTSDAKRAFLAGARMAREQERERAKVLVKYVEIDTRSRGGFGEHARATLAEYRGEA